jgi:hypothetical protein
MSLPSRHLPTKRPMPLGLAPAWAPGLSSLKNTEASMGTMVRATKSDPRSEKDTVEARALAIWPGMPSANIMGTNTTTVVSVEATMAF